MTDRELLNQIHAIEQARLNDSKAASRPPWPSEYPSLLLEAERRDLIGASSAPQGGKG
jgi:hypothetical protein